MNQPAVAQRDEIASSKEDRKDPLVPGIDTKMPEQKFQHYPLPPLSIHKKTFDELCLWIDARIGESIGWQELMAQSGLDHQTITALFFKYESTTPMTWIRRRREARSSSTKMALPALLLPKQKSQ